MFCSHLRLFVQPATRYYPSVFILKPGQLVHINKGRLHAFRKLAPVSLPKTDCHADLRSSILRDERQVGTEDLCVSVAWDWMYRGVSSDGINRELVSTLECAALNRKHKLQSLAIPELSAIQTARIFTSRIDSRRGSEERSLLQFARNSDSSLHGTTPDASTVLKGILPSLRFIVRQHVEAERKATEMNKNPEFASKHESVVPKPNSWENPDTFALDPYGNGDFFCKMCHKELSNAYMHCDGCEKILNKDFNICVSCHEQGEYKQFVKMHPLNEKRHCTINHTGHFTHDRTSHCPCRNGPACKNCSFCCGCSCKCHQWFTLNHRFFSIEDEESLLKRVEDEVGDCADKDVDEETMARLSLRPSIVETSRLY